MIITRHNKLKEKLERRLESLRELYRQEKKNMPFLLKRKVEKAIKALKEAQEYVP